MFIFQTWTRNFDMCHYKFVKILADKYATYGYTYSLSWTLRFWNQSLLKMCQNRGLQSRHNLKPRLEI